ncbi:MAG TPA: glycine cleavage system protein H [Verrucomicrobiae bacterium]|jgi:glycine cleavage system H lipoate-binding protein|nr:glycine cleavage system protein H [Verrucomicrobiae bacterium]
MSILFVLLTFLLILTVMYFRRPDAAANTLQAAPAKSTAVPQPFVMKQGGFEIPQGYCFHPGHTWVVDEGRQNARVGIDAFAGNLFGKIDSIEVADLNRWVRQGQPLCTVTREGRSIQMLSPVEGVLVSVNLEVLKNPNLIVDDPYKNGWLCVVKAPEMATNVKNLLRGTIVLPWLQNSLARIGAMVQQLSPALAQDGGLPVKGLLFQIDDATQHELVCEFFLT